MTTGLTYNQYVTELANLAVVDPADTNFVANLPQCITYAENRIYRDLDLLSTVSAATGFSLSTGSRQLTFPLPTFVTLQEVNVITPAGVADPDAGTRVSLWPVTKFWLDMMYPTATVTGVPAYMAMLNQNTVLVGPWPDQNYAVELVGTVRPDSLSSSNSTTFVSLYLPDLFLMASMVFISGYQRDFALAASQANDAQMPVNYESQYQTLLKSAMVEEARKKFEGGGWTSMSPAVAATPSRG
jgi:hypothetical protein